MNTSLEKQKRKTSLDINLLNNNRLKCISIVQLILVSLLLIVDNNNRLTGLWVDNYIYLRLFYIHVLFLLMAIFGIIISSLTKIKKEIYLLIYIFLAFNLSAFLSGWISPYINGEISVYIMVSFCVPILFSIRPRYSLVLYLQSYLFLMAGLFTNQTNIETLQGNIMNASLVFLLALFISFMLFKFTQKEYFYKNNLEDLVRERTSQLLNTNNLLQLEISQRERIQTEKIKQLTKLLTLEAELSRSNQLIADTIKNMQDGFFAIDKDWRITYLNCAGEKAFAKSSTELMGKKLTDLYKVSDPVLLHFQEVLTKKKTISFELLWEALDNKWFEIRAYPIENGMTCYFRDISSQKKAESEIARLDRLNLVGQLASGIAHEIRNPLSVVRGYLQLLGEKPAYEDGKPTFDLMISELDRANSIITEFLSLAQTRKTELKTQNINGIVNNLYPLLEADAFNQNKQLYFIPGDVPDLRLNSKEISQMILNLVRNGFESMEERQSLTIKTYMEDDKVGLEIKDEGCGIPQENLDKLGTPFFTTKDYGTGLGLATSYKIAESHKAKIRIYSNTSGTTICILFPIPER